MLKTLKFALAAVIGLIVGNRADAAITLGLTSVDTTTIQFNGSGSPTTITFNNDENGNSFGISIVDGSPGGSPIGLFGSISGTFTNLSPVGPPPAVPLTGTGLLTIGPAAGAKLTANIVGLDILWLGKIGSLYGIASVLNLSNVSYSGSNDALLQFKTEATAGDGIGLIGFVTPLNSGPPTTVPEPGNMTTVPEPGSMGMAFTGVALVSLGYCRQQRRKLASRRRSSRSAPSSACERA